MKQNWMLKVSLIAVMIVLFLIPLALVEGVITEREGHNTQVQSEITGSWAKEQVITPPVLVVPYKAKPTMAYAFLLPERLRVEGGIDPEVRYRSIFEATVYRSQLTLSGSFAISDLDGLGFPKADLLWDQAHVVLGVSDMRGLQNRPALTWGKTTVSFTPGSSTAMISPGIQAKVSVKPGETVTFSVPLRVNGSASLQFVPVGKENQVALHSPWRDPSFTGNFLPARRTVNAEGFQAQWEVSYFARSFAQVFTARHAALNTLPDGWHASKFGVSLISPVDFYRQADRAVKYGILFLVFTFTAYFLFEVLTRLRIHLIQYMLVGFALCLFFLLLVSLAELVGFLGAYITACLPIVGLITAYTHAITKQRTRWLTVAMGLLLGLLYTYLYILLQLQDLSLLLGTVGLFLALAVVMFVTRNIDWYGEKPAA